MKTRILAVIVLYKIAPEHSASYQSLLNAAKAVDEERLDLHIVLHDNSPDGTVLGTLPENVSYTADVANTGLTSAYNRALQRALGSDRGKTPSYDWLLTLDQDTALPLDTLAKLIDAVTVLEGRPDVGAVVPQIRAQGKIVSPNTFAAGAWPVWFSAGYTGIPEAPVFAFNSGSLIRTTALRQAGGYSRSFWLDNSDAWIYRQLHRFGKSVYVAGNLILQHDFSMLNMKENVSAARYENVLLAEMAFWDTEMGRLGRLERLARLIHRYLSHWRRGDPKELRRLTRRSIWIRIMRSRRHRIAMWEEHNLARLSAEAMEQGSQRPRVSVCMALYNGEAFVERQLRSVIKQLDSEDEIVMVDDVSRDGTVDRVLEIQAHLKTDPSAPSLVLLRNERNRGVVPTFERAMRSAMGDIIFLCDDDDVWAPNKVDTFLRVFAEQPHTQVVSSEISLIDDQDQPVEDAALLQHRKFNTSLLRNLLTNQFQGSAMAFRASLLGAVLPLPAGKLFLHDSWIGTRNILTGGGTAFIDEPLLLYRRHASNFSRRYNVWKQIKLRSQFVMAHLLRLFQ